MPSEGSRPVLPPRLVAVVLMLGVVVGGFYVGVKGTKRSAFARWQPQIERLLEGHDSYTEFGFPTPPIMAMILAPFCKLPTWLGMSLWLAVKVVLTLAALRWLMLQQRDAWGSDPPPWVPSLALAAAATPIIGDLMHGNINLWILFLVVAAWRALGVGRPILSGLILSLAVACKITPAVLVAYFGWKRAWKATAASFLGLILWLLLIPAAFFGWERNLFMLERWSGLMLGPYVTEGRVERDVRNQSLAGLFQRLVSAPPAVHDRSDDGDEQVDPQINLVDWPPERTRLVWRCIVLASVFGLWFISRRSFPNTDRRWAEHEFALMLLAMLLLSERSWKHHYVTVLPSFVALFGWLAMSPKNEMGWKAVAWMTAFAALLPIIASQDVLKPFAGNHGVEVLQAYGVYVWAAGLLIASHLVVRRAISAERVHPIRTSA